MIEYSKKISFLTIKECWFDFKPKWTDFFSFFAVYHLQNNKKITAIKEISHTIELDLTLDTEKIFSNFSKVVRQQIRKAETDGIVCETSADIEIFVEFFNNFAIKKGTFATSQQNILEKKDYLIIRFAKHNGKILAAHSYLKDDDEKIIRHYQTATIRFNEDIDKNFVGLSNKLLLVNSLVEFKEQGYKKFDLGGYAANTKDESLLGINNYKLKFGGQVVECKDYYSMPYWIMKKVSSLLGRSATV